MKVTEYDEKHSVMLVMFMSVTMESSLLLGKNESDNSQTIKNTEDLTMKQVFDISAKLVSGQDVIYGVETIDWENYSWKYLSWIGDFTCLGKIHENPQSNTAWEQRLKW